MYNHVYNSCCLPAAQKQKSSVILDLLSLLLSRVFSHYDGSIVTPCLITAVRGRVNQIVSFIE